MPSVTPCGTPGDVPTPDRKFTRPQTPGHPRTSVWQGSGLGFVGGESWAEGGAGGWSAGSGPPRTGSGSLGSVFDGFHLDHVDVGEVTLRVRYAGAGAPVVLLHGHPRTHTTWHAVAPRLVQHHFDVAPDLRGYGRSTLPPDAPEHAQSCKRAMARERAQLMSHLGHLRFAVAGHDRGSLLAFRTAMDHPEVVSHLIVMDGMPVIEHLERTDATFARAWWHWWFLGQTEKPAERVICADPAAWYRTPPLGRSRPSRRRRGSPRPSQPVTQPRSGPPGSPGHFGIGRSTVATIRRRRRPARWPRRCSSSSPRVRRPRPR
ncbi:MAG: alpha/beta fold hydrolase [Nocardioidaceae bacterium]